MPASSTMREFSTERCAAVALIGAGFLNIVVNSVLTPLLPRSIPFAQIVNSSVFEWREGLAVACAALLLFGVVGLFLRHSRVSGKGTTIAFAMTFYGTALLLGVEWSQLFDVRDIARRAPDALNALNTARGMSLSDLGGLVVLGIFTIGWLALAIFLMIKARAMSRVASALVVVGILVILLLHPVLPRFLGAIVGNIVLGAGWAGLGYQLLGKH